MQSITRKPGDRPDIYKTTLRAAVKAISYTYRILCMSLLPLKLLPAKHKYLVRRAPGEILQCLYVQK